MQWVCRRPPSIQVQNKQVAELTIIPTNAQPIVLNQEFTTIPINAQPIIFNQFIMINNRFNDPIPILTCPPFFSCRICLLQAALGTGETGLHSKM